QHQRRRQGGVGERFDRRAGGGPADRVLHDLRGDRELGDRRAAAAARRGRGGAVRAGARQGLAADRVRQPGGGLTARRRHPGRARAAVAGGRGGRARTALTYQPSALQRQRQAYRRRQTITSVVIASISTVVIGALLYFVVTSAPGWERVKASFFDPEIARESFPDVLRGLWLNLRLLFFCAIGALALGLGIALLRTLRPAVFFPLRALATSYTYIFRGAPLIIVLYLLTFGVPGLRLAGTPSVLVLGGIALVITYGAYIAEVFRAGIESVHPSQIAAARSLGLRSEEHTSELQSRENLV